MKFIISNDPILWGYFIITYLCFLSFWHSSLVIFKTTQNTNSKKRLLLKLLSIIMWNSLPFHFFFLNTNPTNHLTWVGLALSFCALATYWLSVKSLAGFKLAVIHGNIESNQLYKKGLFKFIRHPFYSAYLLCYVGVLFAYPTIFHFVLASLLLYVYYKAAKSEESNFLNSPLSNEYTNYRKSTGMFVPKMRIAK